VNEQVIGLALVALALILLFTWPEKKTGRPFPRSGGEGPKHPYRRSAREVKR